MGFDPGLEALNRYYAVGFSALATISATAYSSAVNSGLLNTGCPSVGAYSAGVIGGITPSASTAIGITWLPNSMYGDQSTGALQIFTLGASGVIDAGFTAIGTASKLTLGDTKVFVMVTNGY